MLFSIIIPTYNRKQTIVHTIDSIIRQSYHDYEIVVVDDGSTDNTQELISQLQDPRIKYIYKSNGGKHTALNAGLEVAKGDLLLILDSDDELLDGALKYVSDLWSECSKDSHCCGIMARCSNGGNLIGESFGMNCKTMSYLDFHFGERGGKFKDCCEFIKRSIINKYRWPENSRTKFIPESYVFDQIGLLYFLRCSDKIIEKKEYLSSGITRSGYDYMFKNAVGYLYDTVSKIEDILPKYPHKIKFDILYWWKYWSLIKHDQDRNGPRCKRISIIGYAVKIFSPIINLYMLRNTNE